ncbi:SAV_2336 N-terminal domain-related protein [Streptomyces sp. NPDC051907]|uniref:SAV_2336 N-terminal domain-related protein n=1 Tax=Streptomyces sp. NPDC051907 TaxID=3155284 RepID=UPI00343D8F90
MLSELRRILAAGGAELSPEELLDALWLARRLPSGASSALARAAGPGAPEPSDLPAPGEAVAAGPGPVAAGPGPVATGPGPVAAGRDVVATGAGSVAAGGAALHAAPRAGRRAPRQGDRPAAPVRAPEAKALGSVELRLGRALRPLKQLRPDLREWELDEPATVTAMAETGLPDPVLRPGRARWLDLVLLVDDGVSMLLWQRLATETRLLMERSGAFRDVRVYGLDSRTDQAPLLGRRPYEPDSSPLPASAVTDPAGHTLLLVLSDGVGAAWRDGRMRKALERAARVGPTAVLHALPERLWAGSGIRAEEWEVTTRRRGAPNSTWQVADPVLPPGLAPYDRVAVPVLAPTPESLGAWAQLVGSPGASAVLPLLASRRAARPYAATRAPGGDGLLRFRGAASPQAYRLAAHLAAVAPVSVPAMRLVQDALGPEVDTGHLAEVFLGGLMRRTDGEDLLPQHRGFDFAEDTRRILLNTLPADDLVRTTRAVTERLAELADSPVDFPAWLPRPSGPDRLPADAAPFGWMDERLLRRLGVPRIAAPPPAEPPDKPLQPIGRLPASEWRPMSSDDPRTVGPFRLYARHLHGWPQLTLYLGFSAQHPWTAVIRVPELEYEQAATMVRTEAEALARMDGVYAPRLLGHDASAEPCWIATSYARDERGEGPAPNLRTVVDRRGPLQGMEFVSLGRQIANGIERAHRKGVVHGRLLPNSVLVEGREVQIAGWMAASLDGVGAPHGGLLRPRPEFRAPELVQPGAGPTEATDVYALGRILLGASLGDWDVDPLHADSVQRHEPGSLVAELVRCLAPDPAHRPSAAALVRAFAARSHDQSIPALRSTGIGVGEDRRPVRLDLNEREYGGDGPHALLVGPDIHDRHRFLASTVRGLAEANPRDSVTFVCAWHGHSEALSTLAALPQVLWAQDLAARPDAATELRDLVRQGLRGRGGAQPVPRLVIVLDEYERIRYSSAELGIVESLAVVRNQGVHLLIADDPAGQHTLTTRLGAITCRIELTGPRLGQGLLHDGLSRPVPFRAAPRTFDEQLAELDAEHSRGVQLLRAGGWSQAYGVLSGVVSARVALLGRDHPGTMMSRYERGFAMLGLGRHREALAEFEYVDSARTAALGPYHPDTLDARQQHAFTLGVLGRHQEAYALYSGVLASRKQVQGARHPDTLRCQHNAAFTLGALGRHRAAYELARQVLTARIAVLGAQHPDTLVTRHEMGHIRVRMGDWEEALALYETVAHERAKTLGPDHPDTLAARESAARARAHLSGTSSQRRRPEAEGGGPAAP